MTAEEAGEGTYERALQIEGSMAALLSRQSSSLEDWSNLLKVMETTRPWEHLPTQDNPYKDVYKWTQTQFKVGDQPLGREQLVRIIDAYAPGRGKPIVAAFEKVIAQPYFPKLGTKGGRPKASGNPYPDKGNSAGRYGTSADYLMARLIEQEGPEVQQLIGPGRQFESVTAAARHYGIAKKRERYEVSATVSVSNAAARIVEVLGPAKAAELVTAITLQLTVGS